MSATVAKEGPVVVKLGGSVITDKSSEGVFKPDTVTRLLREISSFRSRLILVHGGGGFAHPAAKRYRVSEGAPASNPWAASYTANMMVRLNQEVCARMLEEGMAPFSIPPRAVLDLQGNLSPSFFSLMGFALSAGFTPITYGDVYLVREKAFAIISGDLLAAELALRLKASMLVYATGADGVYLNYPPHKGERPLPVVDRSTRFQSNASDATGGMSYKVEQALRAASQGCECLILNANSPGRLAAALERGQVECTRVVWNSSGQSF
ncbi:MAG: isopentenyl phosphate kinase [Thermoprotei archaeon]